MARMFYRYLQRQREERQVISEMIAEITERRRRTLSEGDDEDEVNANGTSRSLEERNSSGQPRNMHRGYVRSRHQLSAFIPSMLKQAVTSNSAEQVLAILQEGENSNVCDEYGFTPLFLAAFDGHSEIVRLLVTYGANVNKTTPSRSSPLYAACSEGHADIAMYLIENGANVNHKLCDKMTALHAACAEGFSETAHILFSAGADIHAVDDEGCTPLCYASRKGDFNSVQLLVENGADVKHKSYKTGFTPLHEVNSAKGIDTHVALSICECLLRHGCDIDCGDNDGNSSLFYAAQSLVQVFGSRSLYSEDLSVIRFLVESGADVNHMSVNRDTALQECAYNGNYETVKCLVEYGAEIECYDMERMTPLHYAADGGFFKVAKYLIEQGADINAVGKNGYTPLTLACNIDDSSFDFRINYDLVQFLIERGAYVDARADNGCTGLHILLYRLLTVRYENGYDLVATMKTFLRAGCHTDIPDAKNRTVLDYVGWVRCSYMQAAHEEMADLMSTLAELLPLPLTCLCAQVVGRYKLLEHSGIERLQAKYGEFVDMHLPTCC